MLSSRLCMPQGPHAAGTECKQGRRENLDWIFSDVGVLYMNKWNGLDNDALKGLSLPYTMKSRKNWQIYDQI